MPAGHVEPRAPATRACEFVAVRRVTEAECDSVAVGVGALGVHHEGASDAHGDLKPAQTNKYTDTRT